MDGRSGSAVSGSRCLLRPFCLVLVLWPSGAQFPVSSCLAGSKRERMNPLGKFSVLFFFSKLQQSCTEQLSLLVPARGCVCTSAPAVGLQELENKQCCRIIFFFLPLPLLAQVGIKLRHCLTSNNKKPKPTQGGKYFLARFFFFYETV